MRVCVCLARYHETLLEYADESCLPERLGGTSKHTIFDDVGPWSELAPSITSKQQLDLYQSQQLSRWSAKPGAGGSRPAFPGQVELCELHTIPSSQAFDSDNDGVDYGDDGDAGGGRHGGEGGGGGRGTECFTSRSRYAGAPPASASSSLEEARPSLLAWMAQIEEEGEKVFESRAASKGSDTPAAEQGSLMDRLARLESRVASLLDVYPIVAPASDALQGNGAEKRTLRVRNQPAWLSVRALAPAHEEGGSIIGRMARLEQRIEASKPPKGTAGGSGGSFVGNAGGGGRSWLAAWLPRPLACCFGTTEGLKRSLSGPEVY